MIPVKEISTIQLILVTYLLYICHLLLLLLCSRNVNFDIQDCCVVRWSLVPLSPASVIRSHSLVLFLPRCKVTHWLHITVFDHPTASGWADQWQLTNQWYNEVQKKIYGHNGDELSLW